MLLLDEVKLIADSLKIEENSLVTKTREFQLFEADVGSKLRQIPRSNSCQAATLCFAES